MQSLIRSPRNGILTLSDLDQAHQEQSPQTLTVGQICSRDLSTAYPDETLGTAMRRMSTRDIGRLPVVARDRPRHLLGLLRRTHRVHAYDIALTKRAAMRHRANLVRLGASGAVNVEKIVVEAGAPCAGKRMQAITWPREGLIASLRRGQQVLLPHGDTVLLPGAVLAVVLEEEARQAVQHLCQKPS